MTRLRQQLQRLFDIRADEWSRFRALFAAYMLFTVGLGWAASAIRAEIVLISDDLLSAAQFLSALAVIAASVIYTRYVDRAPKGRMFVWITLLGAGLALLALPAALAEPTRTAGYVALWIAYQLLFYLWVIHWGTAIIDIYDARDAKRIFPALGIARPLGAMLAGGVYVALINALRLDTPQIVALWAISLLGVALLLARLDWRGAAGAAGARGVPALSEKPLAEGLRIVRGSRFLRLMALVALLVIAINTMTEYTTATLFRDALIDSPEPARAISSATATLDALGNLATLLIQVALFNRIMKRFDLGTVNLIYPLLVVLTTGGLIVLPGLLTAALAYVNTNALRRVFRDAPIALMYNGVPAAAKGRARAVINGLISPLGVLVAAGLQSALIGGAALGAGPLLAGLLGASALAYFAAMLLLRREYGRSVVRLLEDQSFNTLFTRLAGDGAADAGELGALDRDQLPALRAQVRASDDPDFQAFVVGLIADAGGVQAAPLLTELATDAHPAARRAALAELIRDGVRDPRAVVAYQATLDDPDPDLRALGLRGLAVALPPGDYTPLALRFMSDPAAGVRAAAAYGLVNAPDAQSQAEAVGAFSALLQSDDLAARRAAVDSLRSMGAARGSGAALAARLLTDRLHDPDFDLRLLAAEALDRLAEGLGADALNDALGEGLLAGARGLLADSSPRARLAALALLRHLPDAQAATALTEALDDPDADVRRAAGDALIGYGSVALTLVHPLLEGDSPRAAEAAAYVLGRIAPMRYRAALDTAIERKLSAMLANHARLRALETFADFPGVVALRTLLREEGERMLDETFSLLGGAGARGALTTDVIRESLASPNARTRADALEALESLASPGIAARLAALCDPTVSPDAPARLMAAEGDPAREPLDSFQVLYRAVDDIKSNEALPSTWLRAVVLFALAEIGAAQPDLARYLPKDDEERFPTFRVRIARRALPDGQIDLASVVAAVRFALLHPDPEIAAAARGAMRVLIGKTLIAALHDRPPQEAEMPISSTVERMILLKRVLLFDSLPAERLRALAGICTERLYAPDAVIFRKGDPGDELFVVVEGEVRVGLFEHEQADAEAERPPTAPGSAFITLAIYGPGSVFGEMTVFNNARRSATAIASGETFLLALRDEALRALLYQQPDIAIELLGTFSDRLRAANERIEALSASG